jgi:hypothetical protein
MRRIPSLPSSAFILIAVVIVSPLVSGCGAGSGPSTQSRIEAQKEADAQLQHNLKRQSQPQ